MLKKLLIRMKEKVRESERKGYGKWKKWLWPLFLDEEKIGFGWFSSSVLI
jgi:hypothetical protein